MSPNDRKRIAVIGATGQQGGGVVRALQASGQFKVRALSRNPGKHRQLADEVARRRPGLKVLFTSGYTENAIIHHGRLDPGVLLLAKPYRKSDLARMVRVALAERRAEEAGVGTPHDLRASDAAE